MNPSSDKPINHWFISTLKKYVFSFIFILKNALNKFLLNSKRKNTIFSIVFLKASVIKGNNHSLQAKKSTADLY